MNGEGRPAGGPHTTTSFASDLTGGLRRTRTTGDARVELRRVAIDDLHTWGRCSFCGSRSQPLHRAMILVTHAPGFVCDDVVACSRRREVADRVC